MVSEIKIQITPQQKASGFALFTLGFRPFFLLASILSVVMLPHWMLGYRGLVTMPPYYSAVGWHAHEMLFGYAAAVLAGFLLTSVRMWTGEQTITGKPLIGLTLVWVLGRVLPFFPDLDASFITVIDVLFLPLLALSIGIPILKARQWRNSIFPLILLEMTAGNVLIHVQHYFPKSELSTMGQHMGLYGILLIIVIMAGRVIPWFISHGASSTRPRSLPYIEHLSNWSVAVLGLATILDLASIMITVIAGFTTVIHLLRLSFWISRPVWQVPLLWILVMAYGWTVLGFALLCFSSMGLNVTHLALHAFTTGSIGVMTLGLMARVSLGHSGRLMQLHRLTLYAFYLVNLAALVRVLVPLVYPTHYVYLLELSTLLWVVAFIFFLIIYTPILLKPRLR